MMGDVILTLFFVLVVFRILKRLTRRAETIEINFERYPSSDRQDIHETSEFEEELNLWRQGGWR